MPTLRRDDGSQFIIQPYREMFEPAKGSILKRKIRHLAQNQGENVRLYKQANGVIEAIFSRDPGFLLGETVWLYFDKPENLIYCEAMPEKRQVLIVIIKDNTVFLDAKRSYANLMDELASLTTSNNQYDIYTYGDVPLAASAIGGKFAFDAKNIKSFSQLDESLLQKLPINENAQLQPLELAMASPYLGKSKTVPIAITAVSILTIALIWHLFRSPPQVPQLNIYQAKPISDPYLAYNQALQTPAPNKQTAELLSIFTLAKSIPGWKVESIKYNGRIYTITMSINGGSISQLQNWTDENKIQAQLQANNMTLTIPSTLGNRAKPKNIYKLRHTLALLLDQLRQMLPKQRVSFANISATGPYKKSNIIIDLNNISAGKLILLGGVLNKFPTSINSIQLHARKQQISCNIKLTLLGD